ncbi:RluA family pseudouridine synthase [Desulfatiferula olefinivorans]
MITSAYPSVVVLPETAPHPPTILDFLEIRFPGISRAMWAARMDRSMVLDASNRPIRNDSPYVPGKKVFYFREVETEPRVPFEAHVLHADDHLMVVCKPHFLPVIPSGPYVNECLLNRLKTETGNPHLTPVNRLDRDTAGLVVVSVCPETRSLYHDLFMGGRVMKTYQAISHLTRHPTQRKWVVENRLVPGEPFFRMTIGEGPPNARTRIVLEKTADTRASFTLIPDTGKKHQLRLHLSSLGFGIVNDRTYPDLLPEAPPDFDKPLQLLARSLSFTDPVSGRHHVFKSPRTLSEDW